MVKTHLREEGGYFILVYIVIINTKIFTRHRKMLNIAIIEFISNYKSTL